MDQNRITESDILAGTKVLTLELRSGKTAQLTVKGLAWRAVARFASETDTAERNIRTIEAGVLGQEVGSIQDTLDACTPESLVEVLLAITLLTKGLPSLKKTVTTAVPSESNPTPPGQTTSTPRPSSSSEDIPREICEKAAPPSCSSSLPEAAEDKPCATSAPLPLPAPRAMT